MSDLFSFLLQYRPNPWIVVAILGFSPFTETRIAILYGLLAGLNHSGLFIVAASANILEAAALFFLLGNKQAAGWINRMVGKNLNKWLEKNKKTLEKYGSFALIFLVAAPIPGTGAIIGTVAANMLALDKKKSFIAICAGILLSSLFVLIAADFFMSVFGAFFG